MKTLSRAVVVLAMLAGGSACGSGLSHMIGDNEVSGMDGTYAENISAARQDVVTAEEALKEAEKLAGLARAQEARAAYQEALLEEREANVEMAEAELWVKKAKFELTKLEMIMKSKGQKGVEITEKILTFKAQLQERELAFLDKQREHASAHADREERRNGLNQQLREAGLQEVEDPDKEPAEPIAPPPPAPTVTPEPTPITTPEPEPIAP